MKKIYYILTLVAAAMTISACNNAFEDEGPALNGGEGSDNTITFVVGPETDAKGRTALDLEDGATTLWKATDNAGLYYSYTLENTSATVAVDDVKNVKLKINGEASDNAVFVGNDSPVEWWKGDGYENATHKFYFYYPYKEGHASQSKVEGTLPAEQTYDATASEWDMSKYDFVYATKAEAYGNDVELKIKRAFSVLRLGIYNDTGEDVTIEEVSLTSEGGKILAGTFYVNTTKGEMDNALSNRTDAPDKNIHGSTTAYGYWTSTNSTITTTVTNGYVKAGETIDVRFMLNAGYSKSDVSANKFIDTTTPYLEGDTFTVRIKTNKSNKSTHPAVQFTAGALLRGARAGKSITLEPIPAGEPTVTADIESDHSTKNKFYLNNTITIKGSNLQNAADVKVGGVAAEVVSQTGTELVVKVPDCTGAATTAADYAITYTYEDKEGTLGTISIYPFYHYENITLGIGSDSSKTYTEFASQNSFFVPDLGKVVSSKEWYETPIDSYVINAENTAKENEVAEKEEAPNIALSAKNTLDKSVITEEQYYAVMPYLFFVSFSSNYIAMAAPANSNTVLRNHYIKNDSGSFKTMISYKIWGTPILYYRLADDAWATKVKTGELTTMQYDGSVPNSTTPYHKGTDVSGGVWSVGDVLVIGYSSYAKGGKPSKITDCAKLGFIHFKEVSCADLTTGLALPNREGQIKFDLYWSKKLN